MVINYFRETIMSYITVTAPILSIDETIIKPTIKAATDFLSKAIQLPKGLATDVVDYTSVLKNDGSKVKLATTDRMVYSSTNIIVNDSVQVNDINYNTGRYALFEDTEVHAKIVAGTLQQEITITAEYTTQSLPTLVAWRNRYLALVNQNSIPTRFDATISYPLSNEALLIIDELNRVRNLVGGTTTTPYTYLGKHLADNHNVTVNGDRTAFAIEFMESLKGLELIYPVAVDEPSKDMGIYSVSLEFTFKATLPAIFTINYPIFIGGHPLGNGFIDKSLDYNKVARMTSGDEVTAYGLVVSRAEDYAASSTYGHVIPAYDSFKVDLTRFQQSVLVQAKLAIDKDKPQLVFNIEEFLTESGFKAHKDLTAFIMDDVSESMRPAQRAISLMIVRDGEVLTPDNYTVLPNSDVMATYDMDAFGDYHVVVAVDTYPANMGARKLAHFLLYPDLLNSYIMATTSMTKSELPKVGAVSNLLVYKDVLDQLTAHSTPTYSVAYNRELLYINHLLDK